MKYISLAVFALLNNTSAIKLSNDTDDLFNDNSDQAETLKSIKQTEREMNHELGNLS